MIDYHPIIASALNTILPTHYELTLTSKTNTPCISYMELSNAATDTGDTLGYSTLHYQVKVWANDIKTIQKYVIEVDRVMRSLGFKRISANEMHDRQTTLIQKILGYEALALENYN